MSDSRYAAALLTFGLTAVALALFGWRGALLGLGCAAAVVASLVYLGGRR